MHLKRILLAAAASLLLVASMAAIPAVATAQTSSGNLILNGNASVGLCTTTGLDTMTIPGWTITSGGPDSVCYGSSGFPSQSTPGASSASDAFFAGGSKGNASMQQTIDVSSASAAINNGGVTYSLSGNLGGWSLQTDDADVTITFENAAGTSLGTAGLSAVTVLDRLFTTKFLSRSATGDVPVGTTKIVVTVNFYYGEGNTTDGYVNNLQLSLDTPVTAPVLTPPASDVPHFDHVFFIFMENENENSSLFPYSILGDYIVGNSAAPYENNTLAPMGSLLTQMYATQHPSDPNYLAVTGGSTFNENQDVSPGTVNEPNLSDELNAAGLSWKAYAQGMAGDCDLTSNDTAAGDYYDNDDDAFLDYADDITPASYCDAHNVPLTQLSTDLESTATTPAYSWIVANDYDDMELGGVSAGDSWLSQTLPAIFNSPAWTTQKSLLIVSWDEGYVKSYGSLFPNQVATYVVGSQGTVKAGYQSSDYYDDYSLLSTVEHALGLPALTSNDEYAQPLSDVWTGQ